MTPTPSPSPDPTVLWVHGSTWDVIGSIVQAAAIIVGGIWAYLAFVRGRLRLPRASLRHTITHRDLDEAVARASCTAASANSAAPSEEARPSAEVRSHGLTPGVSLVSLPRVRLVCAALLHSPAPSRSRAARLRMLGLDGPPGREQDGIEYVKANFVPLVKQGSGFRSGYWLGCEGTGKESLCFFSTAGRGTRCRFDG